MTDKDLTKLADMIASKIVLQLFGDEDQRAKARQEFERQFEDKMNGIEQPTDHLASVFADMTDEELLIGELARLQTILMIYEDKEEYEKAGRILKKLKIVQRKLRKLAHKTQPLRLTLKKMILGPSWTSQHEKLKLLMIVVLLADQMLENQV